MELGPLLYKNLYKFEKKLHNVRSIHIFAVVFVGNKFSSHCRVIFHYWCSHMNFLYAIYNFMKYGVRSLVARTQSLKSSLSCFICLRWKVTKLNNGVRGNKITPPECSIFWESVSVFSLCVIINPSFSRRHEIGLVLAFLTSSNSLLKLHVFDNYLQKNWPIEMIFTPKCLFR